MFTRTFLIAVSLLIATAPLAQPGSPEALSDSVRQHLQIELREMMRTDQRVRTMWMYGLFSPCTADSLERAFASLPIEEHIARSQALRAEADARTSPAEKAVLLQRMHDADAGIQRRLRAIIAEHGWPSDERTGADVDPVVFLLHAAGSIDEMHDELMAEVQAGRLPAREFAQAVDKSRMVRGELQLYGTGQEFDSATQSVQPPRIEDIEATNQARRAIGLAPLSAHREAE